MMNCKKKLIALTMASVMIAALTGCGASGQESTATANNTSAAGESNPGGEDGVFTIAYAPNESNTEAAAAIWSAEPQPYQKPAPGSSRRGRFGRFVPKTRAYPCVDL